MRSRLLGAALALILAAAWWVAIVYPAMPCIVVAVIALGPL